MRYIFFYIALLFVVGCTLPSQNQEATIIPDNTNSGKQEVKETKKQLPEKAQKSTSGEVVQGEKVTPEKSNTHTTLKEGRYCILDTCIPDGIPITASGSKFVAKYSTGTDTDEEIKLYIFDPNNHNLSIEEQGFMSSQITNIQKVSDGYIKNTFSSFCGGSTIEQQLFDTKGNTVTSIPSIKIDSISIGVKEYTPSFFYTGSPFDTTMHLNANDGKKFTNEKEISEFLTQKARESKMLFKNYIVTLEKYPNLYVIFQGKNFDMKKFVTIYNDPHMNSKIGDTGYITDQELVKDIIDNFGKNNPSRRIFVQKGDEHEMVEGYSSEMKNAFTVEKFDSSNNYLIYFSQPEYKIENLAEMCKPVVYYYGDENQENTLTLKTKKGDTFTKLIPEFNSENGWNFTPKNNKILVDSTQYDYLYYSLLTAHYSHNKNGWIIRGEDAIAFFEDKLPKIGFNQNEQFDFIDYWKDKYKTGKWYFISFKYKDELDTIIALDFQKKPQQIFRVLLDSYEIKTLQKYQEKFIYNEKTADIFDKFLIQKFERDTSLSSVFEWGGVLQTAKKYYIK